jgi:hypothetical protein
MAGLPLDTVRALDERMRSVSQVGQTQAGYFLTACAFLIAAGGVIAFSAGPSYLSFDFANGGLLPVSAICLGVFFALILAAVALLLEGLVDEHDRKPASTRGSTTYLVEPQDIEDVYPSAGDALRDVKGLEADDRIVNDYALALRDTALRIAATRRLRAQSASLVILSLAALSIAVLLTLYGSYAHPAEAVVTWSAGPKTLTAIVLLALVLVRPLRTASRLLPRRQDLAPGVFRTRVCLGLPLITVGSMGFVVLLLATAPEWSLRILLVILQVVFALVAVAGYWCYYDSAHPQIVVRAVVVVIGLTLLIAGLIAALAESEQWQLLVAAVASAMFVAAFVVEQWFELINTTHRAGGTPPAR